MTRLIVFEGTSGTGKSTLCEIATQLVRDFGMKVKKAKHPTPYLRDKIQEARYQESRDPVLEAQLFAADFRRFVNTEMKENPDTIYVCDRSYITSLADSQHSGLSSKEIIRMNQYSPHPDLLFILECRPEIAMARIKKRCEETGKPISKRETPEYLGSLRNRYRSVGKHFPEAIYLDTEQKIETLKNTIQGYILEAIR